MKRALVAWAFVVATIIGVAANVDTAYADVDNFTITEYDVQMMLGRDDERRSTLRVVETITADFPPNQNQGLERVFVKTYQNRPTNFALESVTDQNGQRRNYHWQGDALRIGDKGVYVTGKQTYVITYTQRDITQAYVDTGRDELYWDIIGTSWRVPIQNVTLRLTVDPALVDAVETELQRYQGREGSTSRFESDQGQENGVYIAKLASLSPGEGLTIALGFTSGTFAEYRHSMWWAILIGWVLLQLVLVVVSIGVVIYAFMRRHRILDRTHEQKTVVTEYLPPDVSITTAARLLPLARSANAAQLLDLAVRHYIKLYQVREAKWYRSAEYEIEVTKPIDDLKWEERELLNDKFGRTPQPGDRLNLKDLQNNTAYYKRLQNNDGDLDKKVRGEYGLRTEDPSVKRWMRRAALILLIVGIVTISPAMLIAALIVFAGSFGAWRLTDRGLAVRRHLNGLKQYISVAETERLQMLQSPDGAAKVAQVIDSADTPAQRVVLYERVLPYAVLFGQEKQWNQQLGTYYEQARSQPDWYSGGHSAGAFNAVALSSAVNGFSTAVTSANSSSSSSGGSSGGGSVGGGGGGGGGGGW